MGRKKKPKKTKCNKSIGMILSWSKPLNSLRRTIIFLCQRHSTCPQERRKVHQCRSTARLEQFSQRRKSRNQKAWKRMQQTRPSWKRKEKKKKEKLLRRRSAWTRKSERQRRRRKR